jgi:hypothetical protein
MKRLIQIVVLVAPFCGGCAAPSEDQLAGRSNFAHALISPDGAAEIDAAETWTMMLGREPDSMPEPKGEVEWRKRAAEISTWVKAQSKEDQHCMARLYDRWVLSRSPYYSGWNEDRPATSPASSPLERDRH